MSQRGKFHVTVVACSVFGAEKLIFLMPNWIGGCLCPFLGFGVVQGGLPFMNYGYDSLSVIMDGTAETPRTPSETTKQRNTCQSGWTKMNLFLEYVWIVQ